MKGHEDARTSVKRAPVTIYTVGHSTRTLDDFTLLLRHYGVGRLVDVRTIPRSRHNPQFNADTLRRSLRNRKIGYRHMKELGGLRHALPDSPNGGWHNASFRGFADYMQTEDFHSAIDRLIALAGEKPTAIMCAEAVPWRCHRSLIGDALVLRGVEVIDVISARSAKPHAITEMAAIDGMQITYPLPLQDGKASRVAANGGHLSALPPKK